VCPLSGITCTIDGLPKAIEEVARRLVAEVREEFEPSVYDVTRAAEYLGFSEGHIRRMVREGKLPDRRHGGNDQYFFFRADLNAAVCRTELA
jgi:excisionase family DNA binding protein